MEGESLSYQYAHYSAVIPPVGLGIGVKTLKISSKGYTNTNYNFMAETNIRGFLTSNAQQQQVANCASNIGYSTRARQFSDLLTEGEARGQ